MPTHIYLTEVTYNPDKKEILAEFRNEERKVVKRYDFYPFLVLPKEITKEVVEDLLLYAGIKGFKIEKKNKYLKIIASSFIELKKISNFLAIHTGKKPLTLEPQRQFLLQKNWNYYDTFILENTFFEKVNEKKDIAFMISKEINFYEAMDLDEEGILSIVEKYALSALLKVPVDKIPPSLNQRTEIFLENMFFSNGVGISWAKNSPFFSVNEFAPYGEYESVSTIDFSSAWPKLMSNNFFNLGVDTINCTCCKPIKLNDSNLLPSSLIKIEFLEDAFYFQSISNTFALNYHKNNPFKKNRI